MKRSKLTVVLLAVLAIFTVSAVMPSCGSHRAYWGVEGDYYGDGYYHPSGKHKHKKHKKPKKHKKHDRHGHHDD